MNKVYQNNRFSRKNEYDFMSYNHMASDVLQNLLLSIEKYKILILKSNINSMLLNSTTATVINCMNHVISEYGEDSTKRYNVNKHIVKETGDNIRDDAQNNNMWIEIVKHIQEIIISNREIDNELYLLMLTMIAQIHERQSLKVSNPIILQDICIKLVENIENVHLKMQSRYLRCLASFVLGNLNNIPKDLFTSLSGAFFKQSEKYLSSSSNDFDSLESLKYCIGGLTNLCYMSSSQSSEDFLAKRFQICGRFLQIFISCLEISPDFQDLSPISRFRMQHQCLHGLNYVSQRPHGLSVDNIERFLDILRVYCGFGLFKPSPKMGDSETTENDDLFLSNGLASLSTTDDVPLSDHQHSPSYLSAAGGRPMRKWEQKTRRLSLELLLKVLDKSWKKVRTSIWCQFMPVGVCGSRSRFDLVNLLERERDAGLRALVLQAIGQCVSSCKELLVTAQHQPALATFISRSHQLACVLLALHSRLLALLVAERAPHTRLQVLAVLLVVIRTAPYHRLKPGIVGQLVTGLRQVYMDPGPLPAAHELRSVVRSAILECWAALVSLESVSYEMRQVLLEPGPVVVSVTPLTVAVVPEHAPSLFGDVAALGRPLHPCWLVQLCVRLAHPALVDRLWTCALSPESWGTEMDPLVAQTVEEGNRHCDPGLRCQALLTISAMLSQHSALIQPSLDTLKRTLLACLDESLRPSSASSSAITNGSATAVVNNNSSALRSHVLRVFSGFLSTLENKKVKRYLGIMQDFCQDENIPSESLQSSKTAYSGISKMSSCATKETENDCRSNNDDLVYEWWSSFLEPVVQCLVDENDAVRRSAAQCLCFICEPVLELLMDRDEVTRCWSLLLAMFRDPSTAARCQAVWSLGYWVAMRPLNSDAHFMGTLIEVCVALCEEALVDCSAYLVCANAAWTISNVVEVLVGHKEVLLACCKPGIGNALCRDLVTYYLISDAGISTIGRLMRLFCNLCALKKAGQIAASARIHENAIRGLGYLCRFITDPVIDTLSSEGLLSLASETFCKAVQLPDKAGRVKVKWNACLSASHVFHNRALIRHEPTNQFSVRDLIGALVASVSTDRYFKVRNNSLVSLIALMDIGGRAALGDCLLDSVLQPMVDACHVVASKTAVPFSEVHRHCLCLYLAQYALLRLANLLDHADLLDLAARPILLDSLEVLGTQELPGIWRQVRHLNRSFNKHTLLAHTLMLRPAVRATPEEVDALLVELEQRLHSPDLTSLADARPAISVLVKLHQAVTAARLDDISLQSAIDVTAELDKLGADSMSDDEGLMTRRPGAALMFSQIYD